MLKQLCKAVWAEIPRDRAVLGPPRHAASIVGSRHCATLRECAQDAMSCKRTLIGQDVGNILLMSASVAELSVPDGNVNDGVPGLKLHGQLVVMRIGLWSQSVLCSAVLAWSEKAKFAECQRWLAGQ